MSLRNRRTSSKRQPKESKEGGSRRSAKEREKEQPIKTDSDFKEKNETEYNTLTKTFMEHPLGVVFIISAILYILYRTFYFFSLQHPEYLSHASFHMVNLRPAVHAKDMRQFLMLGSMGSGVDRVNAGMSQILRLETAMESIDAENAFVRDGTVSHFLGIRYTSIPEAGYLKDVFRELCVDRAKEARDVFRPTHYQLFHNCSRYRNWSTCHFQICLKTLRDEWGCALKKANEDGACSDVAPVARVLHVVQHPVRMIQELLSSVCPGNVKTPHPAFRQLALPFLNRETSNSSCLGQVAWYVVNHNQNLLLAKDAGQIHQTIKYEDSSLCDIAGWAGLRSAETVVYAPNEAKLSNVCDKFAYQYSDAVLKLPEISKKADLTRSLPMLSWKNISEAGGLSLEHALRDLCEKLKYDTTILEFSEIEVQSQEER